MHALYSGKLGIALLTDGKGTVWRMDVGKPGIDLHSNPQIRDQLYEAYDLKILDQTTEEAVRKILEQRYPQEQALTWAHYLIDRNFSDQLRGKVAARLERLAAHFAFVRHTLYLAPAPPEADLAGAIAASAETPKVKSLFEELQRDQPLITQILNAWEHTEAYLQESEQERRDAFRRARDAGWFYTLAKLLREGKKAQLLLFEPGVAPDRTRLTQWVNQVSAPQSKPQLKPEAEPVRTKDKHPKPLPKAQGKKQSAEQKLKKVQDQVHYAIGLLKKQELQQFWKVIADLEQSQDGVHLCQTLCNLAKQASDLGFFECQLALTEKAVAANRKDPQARTQYAEALLDNNRLDDALDAYQTTTRDFPPNVVARCGLAQTLLALNRLDDALAEYQATTRDFPQNVVARCGLAQTLLALNRLDDALAEYETTARDFPQNVVARCGLAQALLALNRLDDALAAYQATTLDFPQDVVARCGLAQTLLALNRLDDALAAFQATTRDFPQNVVARCGLAQTLLALNRLDDALAAYQTTTRDFPQDVVARNGHAQTLLALQRLDDALVAFQATTRDFPQDVVARCGLAQTLLALQRLDDALAAYQTTVRDFPHDAFARCGLAQTLLALNRLDDALVAYQQTRTLFPNNRVCRTALAHTLILTGATDEALALLPETPVTADDWIGYHVRGMAYLRTGQLDRAEAVFSKGASQAPARSLHIFQRCLFIVKLRSRKSIRAELAQIPEDRRDVQLWTLALHDASLDQDQQAGTLAINNLLQFPSRPVALCEELTLRLQGTGNQTDDWLLNEQVNLFDATVGRLMLVA